MEELIALPASIKIIFSFVVILLLYRFVFSLGWSIAICSLGLLFWNGTGLNGSMELFKVFLNVENFLITIVILQLLLFTELLNGTGRISKTANALKYSLNNDALLLAAFPAIIGLLPMPGGALVSAPLVASIDSKNRLNITHKAMINYWYRHIWEYWWPLYPGVVLTLMISKIPPMIYYISMFPFTLFALLSGYIFLLRPVPKFSKREKYPLLFNDIWVTAWPIASLLLVTLIFPTILKQVGIDGSRATLISMSLGLALTILIMLLRSTCSLYPVFKKFLSKKTFAMMIIVIAVQLFSTVLSFPIDALVSNGTLVTIMRDEFATYGIPIVVIIILLPLIAGFVTGISFGFVGATFPLIFELIGANAPTNTLIATAVLAYTFGYVGMLLSPVHICFIVTNEYFGSKLHNSYNYLIGPILTIIAGSLLCSSLYYFLIS